MGVPTLSTRSAKQAGFSLIELMIVIVIMGILLTLVFSNIDVMDKAKVQKANQEIGKITVALEEYRSVAGTLPPSGGLNALVSKPANVQRWRQFIKELPKDPWGNDYRYLNPGTHNSAFDIYSIGADGREGSDDDIGSWALR